ncbi:MAG: cation:proton antiporter [Comamonadaceae bacterium]|nr:cation:proton antiporter [Comamonadaceae bacterium]
MKFLSGAGAIVLTFLAGAELDPVVFRAKWREATAVGLVSFAAPFFGCAAVAYWGLGWSVPSSWLAGIAMSTTSVAVVYAVMLEFGLNVTDYGKTVLAACFITDLATVIALGFIFAPFTYKTLIFVAVSTVAFVVLPWITPRFFRRYGGRPSELEAKFLMLCLFGLGALATWADSEAVLPAYVIGMVLAGTVGKDHALIRRLRTLTFGLLTPFYFIRAGSLVSVPALVAAPAAFLVLLLAKMATKIAGVYPVTRAYGSRNPEAMYTTLLMSTGLTFGTISALFGLSHQVIDQAQYSAAGGGGDRQRGGPHPDCQRLFPAAASAAAGRTRSRRRRPAARIAPAKLINPKPLPWGICTLKHAAAILFGTILLASHTGIALSGRRSDPADAHRHQGATERREECQAIRTRPDRAGDGKAVPPDPEQPEFGEALLQFRGAGPGGIYPQGAGQWSVGAALGRGEGGRPRDRDLPACRGRVVVGTRQDGTFRRSEMHDPRPCGCRHGRAHPDQVTVAPIAPHFSVWR